MLCWPRTNGRHRRNFSGISSYLREVCPCSSSAWGLFSQPCSALWKAHSRLWLCCFLGPNMTFSAFMGFSSPEKAPQVPALRSLLCRGCFHEHPSERWMLWLRSVPTAGTALHPDFQRYPGEKSPLNWGSDKHVNNKYWIVLWWIKADLDLCASGHCQPGVPAVGRSSLSGVQ